MLLYEPATIVNEVGVESSKCFIASVLSMLPEYLREFAPSPDVVVSGPAIVTCYGPGTGEHYLLKAEGMYKCNHCMCTCCQLCISDSLCLHCYGADVIMPNSLSLKCTEL